MITMVNILLNITVVSPVMNHWLLTGTHKHLEEKVHIETGAV